MAQGFGALCLLVLIAAFSTIEFWALVILFGALAAVVVVTCRDLLPTQAAELDRDAPEQPASVAGSSSEQAFVDHLESIDADVNEGRWDDARRKLRKISYDMVRREVTADDKALFRQFMTEFAAVDPLFQAASSALSEVVAREPGVLQSKLYARFPAFAKEDLQYVLYFGHELGLWHRQRQGNTYRLMPAGRIIDG